MLTQFMVLGLIPVPLYYSKWQMYPDTIHSNNLPVQSPADALPQQWLACSTGRASWRPTKLQPIGNERMRSPVIPDHPGPDWGESQPCLCASPNLFSYPDTLMLVMHGETIRTHGHNPHPKLCKLLSTARYINILCKSHNIEFWHSGHAELCCEKLQEITQNASFEMIQLQCIQLCVCTVFMCLCVCVFRCVCTFSYSVSTLVWQRAVSERTGQYYWLFVWRVSPCRSVTPAEHHSADGDALTDPLSHRQSSGGAEWWPGHVRGGWVKRHKEKMVCVCVRKHREEEIKVHL